MKSKLLLFLTCSLAFVYSITGYAQTIVSVGTGTSGSTGGSNGTPIYRSSAASSFDYGQSVQLYTQTDLANAGIFSGATISSIGLFKTNAFTMTAGANASLTINMKNSTLTTLAVSDTFANLTAGSQIVYQSATVDNTVIPPTAGVVEFPLSSSFVYTGGSIEIGFDFDASSFTGNPSTGAFNWAYDNAPGIQARGISAATPITGSLTGTFTRRHQLQVTFTGGATCTQPPVPGTTVVASGNLCAGSATTLGVTGDAPGAGSTYLWEFAADNVNFVPAAGTNDSISYTFTLTTSTSGSYRRTESCGATSAPSAALAVSSLVIQPDTVVESFDTYLPACWTEAQGLLLPTTTLTGTTSAWAADGFLNNGTTGSARIEIWTTTTDEWLISPTYNLTGNEQLVFDLGITFWNTTGPPGLTGVDDKFAVVISTDDGVTWSSANTLRLWDNAGSPFVYNNISNTGETIILDLSAYTGNVKFGFYGESTISNADNNVYVDNVQVRSAPSCLDITALTNTAVTTTTADFTWDSNNANRPARFEYIVDATNSFPAGPDATATPTGSFPVGNSSASVPIAQSGQLTGLTPATTYRLYVREVCSATDRSPWTSAVIFTTACEPATAFSENFDAVVTPFLPTCWTSFSSVIATGTQPSVITSTVADNSPPHGVSLQSGSANGGTIPADVLLISPELSNLSAQSHRLRFFLDANVSTSSVEVGTITDPTNPTTFTAITTIPATLDWVEHTVNFNNYTGSDRYIAFRHVFTTTFDNLYLDDIVWEAIPPCQEPTALAVSSFTATTVTLNWINANTSTLSSIEYGAPGFTLGTGTVVAGQGNTATITGLTPQTAYEFYVTQDCSAAGDGLSVSTGPVSVTTACVPVVAPYFEDFELFNDTTNSTISNTCWSSTPSGTTLATRWDVQNGAGGTPSAASNTGPTGAFDGDSFVYLETSSGALDSFADFITPSLDLSALTAPNLSFYYHMFGATINRLEILVDNGTGAPTLVNTITGQQQTASSSPWLKANVSLSAYANQTITVIFRGYRGSSFTGDISIDAVSIEETPSCFDVTAITASAITANSASISWTENNTPPQTAWEVVVQTAGTAAPTTAGATNASAIPYLATGLSSSTTYDVYVRTSCGSAFAGPISFTTPAVCGDTVYDTGGPNGDYSNNEDYTVTYLPDAPGNVVTLNFTLVDLEFCCDTLRVYDGLDTAAPAFTTDLEAPASFRATNPAGAITIRFTSDSSVVKSGWVALYTCAAPPSCLEPTALAATAITATTAQLSWTDGNTTPAPLYDVEVVLAGTTPTGVPTNAGVSNPFVVTGLTSNTAYEYYVRAACSAADFSPFSGPFTFTTLCAPVTAFPVNTTFANHLPNSCWSEAGAGEFASGPSSLGASNWKGGRAYTNAAGVVVPSNVMNLYRAIDREWLISEVYSIGTGDYNLAVEVALTSYRFSGTSTATNTAIMGSDDSVILGITNDNGATWTALTTWNVGNQPAVTGTEYFFDLSTYTGDIQFAFFASDGTINNTEDYDFHVGSLRLETTLGMNDNNLAASLSLYPNPVNGDELTIAFSQPTQDKVQVSIINMTGQLVRQEQFNQVAGIIKLNDMARLATGVYFVNVTQGSQTATLKFIKQ